MQETLTHDVMKLVCFISYMYMKMLRKHRPTLIGLLCCGYGTPDVPIYGYSIWLSGVQPPPFQPY